jgi:hypothetical protein
MKKKHPRRNQNDQRFTDEVIETFVRHEQLEPIHGNCDDGENCRSPRPGLQHCPECRTYFETNIKLGELLGIKVWQSSPVEAIICDPPDWMTEKTKRKAWRESWLLRRKLEKIAAERGLL